MDKDLELTPEERRKFAEFNQPSDGRPIRPLSVKDEQIMKLQEENEDLKKKLLEFQNVRREEKRVKMLSKETKFLLFNITGERITQKNNKLFKIYISQQYYDKLNLFSSYEKQSSLMRRKLFYFIIDDFYTNYKKEIQELENFEGDIDFDK